MPSTLYVVHAFRGGRKAVTHCFGVEERARAHAAYLGESFDGVIMWCHTVDIEAGIHDGPRMLLDSVRSHVIA
ncbi:MAG: hypothetical protein ACYC0F_03540 [Rhodanobacter sp.]